MGLALWLAAMPALGSPLTQSHDGPVRVAVVGATRARGADFEAEPLVRSITRWDPHAVLLTGGYVQRGTAVEWRDWRDRWTTLGDRAVGVPDRSSRRGDRKLTRWRAARIGGHVDDLPGSSWSAGTLTTDGVRWRVVVLDVERDALGPRWLDERSWLPKVLTDTRDYDHLIVLAGRPLASLEQGATPGSVAVEEMLDLVSEHTAPAKLLAVISGGTATNEVLLHNGSFGEVHLVAGNGRIPAKDLDRRGSSPLASVGEMALVDGFDAALAEAWTRRAGGPLPDRYDAGKLPIRGWWMLELDGHDLALAFQLEEPDGYREVYRIAYTRTMGWVAGSEP